MSILRNLIPGQYQIGDLVFGRGTTVPVEIFDIKPYDINGQDFQLFRNDEINFGTDQFKPTTVEMTFHVRYNWLLPQYAHLIPNFWDEMPTVADFSREWRFDEGRKIWNEHKPLYFCNRNGDTRVIWGRPGKFTHGENTDYTEAVECLGEWRRSDTLYYSARESVVEVQKSADPTFVTRVPGIDGDMETWLRVLMRGPLTNPKITIGDQQVGLNLILPAGKVAEISSYPWQRRAVGDNRQNIAANLNGKTKYLDRLVLPIGTEIPIRWTSDELNTFVPALGNKSWEQDINDLYFWDLPDIFTTIHGRVVVGIDIFNPAFFVKYLRSAIFADQSAVLYADEQFNTAYQYSEAKITEPFIGSSAIVIMSNDTMTNFACIEVQADFFAGSWLKIRSGTAYNNTTIRAQWQNTIPFGWRETDVVGIGYDPNTKIYQGYLNRQPITGLSWHDPTGIVNTGSTNRRQGFIFDLGGNLFTVGTGFRDILSFDKAVVPVPVGQVLMLWHDAWSSPV